MPPLDLSRLECPSFAFRPDEWTEAFQTGLQKDGLTGQEVFEVGVGTGVNAHFALSRLQVTRFFGADLDERLLPVARRNVDRALSPELAARFSAIEGSTDLLTSEAAIAIVRERVRVVIACIPQALRPKGVPEHPDDIAHYYPEEPFRKYPFNRFALGLNEALLRQFYELIQQAQDPSSKYIILNLGGRVGRKVLLDLFRTNGLVPHILHEQMIPQCPTTHLDFFVKLERTGTPCEFFSDAEGQLPITAATAEARRLEEQSVFHKIYVIKGTLKTQSDIS
ncbi:hypothetical protein HZA43_03490 [Candidatus Peregrinibacteria bacterium]|nr:hypothetical protein [Candidatus Peregrinibacteria bacterium]